MTECHHAVFALGHFKEPKATWKSSMNSNAMLTQSWTFGNWTNSLSYIYIKLKTSYEKTSPPW